MSFLTHLQRLTASVRHIYPITGLSLWPRKLAISLYLLQDTSLWKRLSWLEQICTAEATEVTH